MIQHVNINETGNRKCDIVCLHAGKSGQLVAEGVSCLRPPGDLQVDITLLIMYDIDRPAEV